jgi:hypothetical protein
MKFKQGPYEYRAEMLIAIERFSVQTLKISHRKRREDVAGEAVPN